ANRFGNVAGGVDHGVEGLALERRDVALAVAAQAHDLRKPIRVRPAAVEHRDVVAAGQGVLDERATEELRPAEDQDLHVDASSPLTRQANVVAVVREAETKQSRSALASRARSSSPIGGGSTSTSRSACASTKA